ncbi:MAG TPA: hypothetical protein VGZ47_10990 [Gemmataceae bacterium]|jgi:hypothetical protein|nr:hypothetical protein [Gemmataceae bacterium]
MLSRSQRNLHYFALALVFVLPVANTRADEPAVKGQRIFTCGHSFHFFVPQILADMAKKAGIQDHQQVGTSFIGGSRVIQHWDVPEEKNKAKEALKVGKVDVLTLSPILLPDPGIENFAKLALEHIPDIRIFVQESWLPYDEIDPKNPLRGRQVDHNAATVEVLQKRTAEWTKSYEDHVQELNKKFGKQVLFIVPVSTAVVALRGKIIDGKAPGLKTQEDLFTDAIGHAKPPLAVLVAYCHFAAIYRKNPVGLPVPMALAKSPEAEELNKLLQELAWDAVSKHPMSGVKAEGK